MDSKNGKRGGDFAKRGHYGAVSANFKGKSTAVGGGNGQRGGVHAKRGHGARSASIKGSPTAAANKASIGGRGQRDGSNASAASMLRVLVENFYPLQCVIAAAISAIMATTSSAVGVVLGMLGV